MFCRRIDVVVVAYFTNRCRKTNENLSHSYSSSSSSSTFSKSTMKKLIDAKEYRKALDLLEKEGEKSSDIHINLALKACTRLHDYQYGKKIHKELSPSSLNNLFIQTSLIHFYSKWTKLSLRSYRFRTDHCENQILFDRRNIWLDHFYEALKHRKWSKHPLTSNCSLRLVENSFVLRKLIMCHRHEKITKEDFSIEIFVRRTKEKMRNWRLEIFSKGKRWRRRENEKRTVVLCIVKYRLKDENRGSLVRSLF
jgi:hypothetical protein